jgi:hypothetical protein
VLVQYLSDSLHFAETLDNVIVVAGQLLGSKTASDVKEIVEFYVTSAEFGLSGALVGIRKMLALMWSKESDIKQAAMDAYKRLYLSPDPAMHTTPKARGFVGLKDESAVLVLSTIASRCHNIRFAALHCFPNPLLMFTLSQARQAIMAKNLIELTIGANLGDLTSMEEMVGHTHATYSHLVFDTG